MSSHSRYGIEPLEERMALNADPGQDWSADLPPIPPWAVDHARIQSLTGELMQHFMEQSDPRRMDPPKDSGVKGDKDHVPLPVIVEWLNTLEDDLHRFSVRNVDPTPGCLSRFLLVLQHAPELEWRPDVFLQDATGEVLFGRSINDRPGLLVFEFEGIDFSAEYAVSVDQRGLAEAAQAQDFFMTVQMGVSWAEFKTTAAEGGFDPSESPMLLVTDGNWFNVLMQSWSDSQESAGSTRLSIVDSYGNYVFDETSDVGATYSANVSLAEGEYYVQLSSYDEQGSLAPDTSYQLTMAVIDDPIGPTLGDAIPDAGVDGSSAPAVSRPILTPFLIRAPAVIALDDGISLPGWSTLGELEGMDAVLAEISPQSEGHSRPSDSAQPEVVDAALAIIHAFGLDARSDDLDPATRAALYLGDGVLAAVAQGIMAQLEEQSNDSAIASHPLLSLLETGTVAQLSKGASGAKESEPSQSDIEPSQTAVTTTLEATANAGARPSASRTVAAIAAGGILLLRPSSLLPSALAKRFRRRLRIS